MIGLDIDISDLYDLLKIDTVVQDKVKKAAEALTVATKAHMIEEANKKLHTRRSKFIEALSHFQLDENTWVINLDKSAVWIDSGLSAHSMVEDLLKSPKAKRAADGSKYLSIPFEINKPKGMQTPAQQTLLATVKKELRAVGVTPNGIEMGADNKPKLGLVRSLDILKAPVKTRNVPGQGKGPLGAVMQGPTGIPFLSGVRVYQKPIKNKDGEEKIKRFVMTFRTVSSKHAGQGRWDHPGLPPANIMDEAVDWAQQEWTNKIAPALLDSIIAAL